MKNLKLSSLFVALIFVFGANSCRKYEEGPLISFRSKKARVEGEWFIEEIIESDGSGSTYTDDGSDIYTFYGDGTATNTTFYESFNGDIITNSLSFDWKLINNKENIRWDFTGGNFQIMEIIKLKNDEMWLKVSRYDRSSEVHFRSRY